MKKLLGVLLVVCVATTVSAIPQECKDYMESFPRTAMIDSQELGDDLESDTSEEGDGYDEHESNPFGAVTDENRIWPNGILYYEINTTGYTEDQIVQIKNGIDRFVKLTKSGLEDKNCIQILPRTDEEDYVSVVSRGCGAYFGRKGGRQEVRLGPLCLSNPGNVMRMFLHTFGFFPEHSRHDRDEYVVINWDNIDPANQAYFEKLNENENSPIGTKYDYYSLLQYSGYYFAVDRSIPTICPKEPYLKIGEKDSMSYYDIERVQMLYKCINPLWQVCKHYMDLHPNTGIDESPEYKDYLANDILVDVDRNYEQESNPLGAVTDPSYIWPNGIIYYATSGYTDEEIVTLQNGMSELVNLAKVDGKTCIQIIPRNNEDNYLYVKNYDGCASYVGRKGGKQDLHLESYCLETQGDIMHEFLHAFGFEHEHSRSDRDDYVTINWDNIKPGLENNFKKMSESKNSPLGTKYDYGSIMHYTAYSSAVDPNIPTMCPKSRVAEIGYAKTLSAIDIERVQILYKCITPSESEFFHDLDPNLIPES